MFSLCINFFVSRIMQKSTPSVFTKFGGKTSRGPWKNPLEFSGSDVNGQGSVMVIVGGDKSYPCYCNT